MKFCSKLWPTSRLNLHSDDIFHSLFVDEKRGERKGFDLFFIFRVFELIANFFFH